jgi:uncharacterized protein (DUF952 family)
MTNLVLKITDREQWARSCETGHFDGSDDDKRDGFIHLSTPDQLDGTAIKYFRHKNNLVLVAFDPVTLGEALKWEPSRDGALFPHYYGPLPTGLAKWSRTMELDGDGVPRLPKDKR